jgi:hypothetical protein
MCSAAVMHFPARLIHMAGGLLVLPLTMQMLSARSGEQQQLPTISVNVTAPAQQIRCDGNPDKQPGCWGLEFGHIVSQQ